jgi:twitching motility protein PilT
VFGTLHTSTAASTVDRIIDQFPADRQPQIRVMLSESLKAIVSQVLLKKKGGGRVAAMELLIGELVKLGVNEAHIAVMLNNRIRSDTQMPYTLVQEELGYPITVTLTPAPELLTQATRMQTAAILCQPEGITSQQILKLVDHVIKSEAAGK